MDNKKLKNYVLIQNLANGLVSPFMSFLAAVIGVPSIGISLVSSASSFFSGVVQVPLRRTSRIEQLLKLSTLLLAILWFTMAFIAYGNPTLYLITYIAIAIVGGANSFAWALIMERMSRGSRGQVLATYAFYGSIGGLLATLMTGLIVGSNYALMHYVFITSAFLILMNVINIWNMEPMDPECQVTDRLLSTIRNNRKLIRFLGRFLLITFPLSYALANNVYVIYVANTIAGFTNSASNVAYISFVYDNSEDRRTAVSLYNLFYGIGTLIGSLMSGALVTVVSNYLGLRNGVRYMLLSDATARALIATLYMSV
ncbi:major facilitator superfamily MFS_1 [Vulcanisaeta moutnovskia 768-28]|uniref:Major facilitator superfamily MFS_1 n=1 Tax=Vulcanisaeta moutnovskia (strain 768-28) TaxID=985053 RepID=F0QT99_VULM7|nr:MFS transporter [Vulcanisaeta moutnovskia]ADY00441.1 major facilitator superfamily MFS_1 [Vulcanisaeta moutnovskia 768-28]